MLSTVSAVPLIPTAPLGGEWWYYLRLSSSELSSSWSPTCPPLWSCPSSDLICKNLHFHTGLCISLAPTGHLGTVWGTRMGTIWPHCQGAWWDPRLAMQENCWESRHTVAPGRGLEGSSSEIEKGCVPVDGKEPWLQWPRVGSAGPASFLGRGLP